jgi:thiamine pyrophosphate-dependent acetolactate synthase large subunit-like protein
VAATRSHVPILVIVGESPTTVSQSPQNVDQRGLAAVVEAGFHHARGAEELEAAFWAAIAAIRRDGRPQVLSLAEGILEAEVALDASDAPRTSDAPAPSSSDIAAIVEALEQSTRPVIIAGAGAVTAGAIDDIAALGAATGAWLTTTLRACRAFEGHPNDLGLCGGWSAPRTRAAVESADLIVAFGASLNSYTTDRGRLVGAARVIRIDTDPTGTRDSIPGDLTIPADAGQTAALVHAAWRRAYPDDRPAPGPPLTEREVRDAVFAVDVDHDPQRGLDPRRVYERLDAILPSDRIVATDSGRFLGTLPSIVRARDAKSFLIGNSYGSIGQGLGIAVGASAGAGDRPVVLFAGDGGFMMSTHDLDAVRLNGLRLVVVILDDQLYGSDAKYLRKFGLPDDVIRQSLPDIPTLAAAFGGRGTVVTELAQLDALDTTAPGLTLVDVRVDPEVNVRDVTAAWSGSAGGH